MLVQKGLVLHKHELSIHALIAWKIFLFLDYGNVDIIHRIKSAYKDDIYFRFMTMKWFTQFLANTKYFDRILLEADACL